MNRDIIFKISSPLAGTTLAVLAASMLTACGPSGYKPKLAPEAPVVKLDDANPENLFPFKDGYEWEYNFTSTTRTANNTVPESGRLRIKVVRVEDTPKGKKAELQVEREGVVVDKQVWLSNDKGIYQLAAGEKTSVPYTPMQPFALFPLSANMKFDWKGKGATPLGMPGTIKTTNIVRGPEPVDTGVGRRTGIAIESRTEFTSAKIVGAFVVTTWYQPSVGIIRMKQVLAVPTGAVTTTLTLAKAPI